MFSPSDLAALVAVAEAGSVRGAAAVLNRTQPAVTQAVHRLEDAVGFALLDRSTYRARLTEHGESFVKQAKLTLSQARNLRAFAELLATGVEPRIKLEVDSAIPSDIWIELLRTMSEQFPGTIVEIECGEGASNLRRLLRGDADLGLLFDATVQSQQLTLERLSIGIVEFCNVIRGDQSGLLGDETSAKLPQILVADFEGSSPDYGAVEGKHCWRVGNHQMQADAIVAGLGWGTVARHMVDTKIADGTLLTLPYEGLSASSFNAISLYRKRGKPIGSGVAHLWEHAHAHNDYNDKLSS